jgi:hypothetical protein
MDIRSINMRIETSRTTSFFVVDLAISCLFLSTGVNSSPSP